MSIPSLILFPILQISMGHSHSYMNTFLSGACDRIALLDRSASVRDNQNTISYTPTVYLEVKDCINMWPCLNTLYMPYNVCL